MKKAKFIRSLLSSDLWLSTKDLFEIALYEDESIEYQDASMVIVNMSKSGLLYWRVDRFDRRVTQYRLKINARH